MSSPCIRERSPILARSSSCHKVATAIGLAPVNRDCAAYCDLRPTKGCFARRFFCKISIFTTDSPMHRLASSSCHSTSSPRNRRSTTSRWRRRLPLELGGRTAGSPPHALRLSPRPPQHHRIRVVHRDIHLPKVNANGRRFQKWIIRAHGVVAQYLPNDLGWRRCCGKRQ